MVWQRLRPRGSRSDSASRARRVADVEEADAAGVAAGDQRIAGVDEAVFVVVVDIRDRGHARMVAGVECRRSRW